MIFKYTCDRTELIQIGMELFRNKQRFMEHFNLKSFIIAFPVDKYPPL